MLSQFKVYFITVTVIIFILMVVRTFNNRIQQFDISSGWPKLHTERVKSNKTEEHQHVESLKRINSSLQNRPLIFKKQEEQDTEYKEIDKEPNVSSFFADYKQFMGKSLTFHTENQNPFLKDDQYEFFQKSILDGGLNITRLAMLYFHSKMTSYEEQKLIGQPVNDVRDIGDEIQSEFILLNTSTQHFYVGDVVAVRVDIFNGMKIPSYFGGDEVRVWMKDSTKGVSMAVDVEDLKNGSYVANLPLLLPGNASIFSCLAYPKEVLRSIFFLRAIMKAVRLNAGGFVSTTASEATMCSPFPIDYHGNGLCNLTSANQERSWYCGKPVNPALKCHHWNETRDMEFPYPLPVGLGELSWFDKVLTGKKHYLRALQDSVLKIHVKRRKPKNVLRGSKPYCFSRSARDTWTEAAPRGMFYRMTWVPFACKLKRLSYSALSQHLKGHTIHLIGDSNLLSWMDIFSKKGLCTIIKNAIDDVTGRVKTWHDPTNCVNEKHNLTVRWRTHGLPFHSNPDHWSSKANMISAATTIDQLPVSDKQIVLIHLFMHFSTHHSSVFLDRIRAVRDAVQRLLVRSPSVKVFIRGPHIAYREWPAYLGGDAQGPLFRQILREEFEELYDKVYFLDFWDMTVAGENRDFHPTVLITLQMIDVFFGHAVDTTE